MKTIFLTSSPTGPLDGSRRVQGFDRENGFRANLLRVWPENARCLMITAFPSMYEASEEMTGFYRLAAVFSGCYNQCFDLWDDRTEDTSEEALLKYNVIFLGGGHVPTQNEFLQRLDLKKKLEKFDGLVIGTSAGSMNCAETVYAEPEESGEAVDPAYQRFLPGLGLTETMILPHYQMLKNNTIDGLRLFEDVIYPDSFGRRFLALPDGSYLLSENGKETVYGEAWEIRDGRLTKLTEKEPVLWKE